MKLINVCPSCKEEVDETKGGIWYLGYFWHKKCFKKRYPNEKYVGEEVN